MSFAEMLAVPPEDRDLFMRWMVALARADGVLAPEEMSVLHELVMIWDLKMEDVVQLHRGLRDGPILGTGAPPAFLDRRSAYLLVRMLVRLGHEDGSYDEEERKAVHEVARRYSVPMTRVVEMEDWVATSVAHQARGAELLQVV